MTLGRSDYAELPATNPSSITLASGREISKGNPVQRASGGRMGSTYATLRACSGATTLGLWSALLNTLIWAISGIPRHTRCTSRLPTITSATPLIRNVRRHRADRKRAARATVVFHGASLLRMTLPRCCTFRFVETVILPRTQQEQRVIHCLLPSTYGPFTPSSSLRGHRSTLASTRSSISNRSAPMSSMHSNWPTRLVFVPCSRI